MTFGALLFRTTLLCAIGAVIMVLGSIKTPHDVQRARGVKFIGFFVIAHAVVLLGFLGTPGLLSIATAIVIGSALEARRAWPRIPEPRPSWLITVALAVAVVFVYVSARADQGGVIWLFMVCAAFDGFGQVVGQLIGRRPLVPSISPAKTVEGFVGALIGALLVAVWLRALPGYDLGRAVALGTAVAAASFVGDLSGSWTKRQAGIKDFSAILPGQGGVIDRFNSFVVAMALVGAWL